MLSLLLAVRFPIGPTHGSISLMRDRVSEALLKLDRLYPREIITGKDRDEWERLRAALRDFLDIDSKRRMHAFKKYDVGESVKAKVKEGKKIIADRKCKSTERKPLTVQSKVRVSFRLKSNTLFPSFSSNRSRLIQSNGQSRSGIRLTKTTSASCLTSNTSCDPPVSSTIRSQGLTHCKWSFPSRLLFPPHLPLQALLVLQSSSLVTSLVRNHLC